MIHRCSIFVKEELVELVLCQQPSLSDSVADTPTADALGETTLRHDLNCHIASDVPDPSTPSLVSEDDSAPPEPPTTPTHVTSLEPDFQESDQVNSFFRGIMVLCSCALRPILLVSHCLFFCCIDLIRATRGHLYVVIHFLLFAFVYDLEVRGGRGHHPQSLSVRPEQPG